MMGTQLQTDRQSKLLFILFCIGACLLPISKAQTNQPLSQRPPIWSVEPKKGGYSLSTYRSLRRSVGGETLKIQFLDDRRLALACLTPEEIPAKPIGPA